MKRFQKLLLQLVDELLNIISDFDDGVNGVFEEIQNFQVGGNR